MKHKKILWTLFFSILLYSVVMLYVGLDKIVLALSNFSLFYLPIIITLVFIGLLVESLRWHYYLKVLGIKIAFKLSFFIFFASLSAGFMPMKSGELIRYYLLKRFNKTPFSKSLPVHFVGNILVFLVAAIFSIPLILSFNLSLSLTVALVLSITFILIVKNKRIIPLVIKFCEKIPLINKYTNKFKYFHYSSNKLTKPKILIISFLITLAYSSISYSVFYLTLTSLGIRINMFYAMSIYAFSLVVGALSMLPGGLGATEGTLFTLLFLQGVPSSTAIVATVLIRIFSFWLTILAGLVFFGTLNKRSQSE